MRRGGFRVGESWEHSVLAAFLSGLLAGGTSAILARDAQNSVTTDPILCIKADLPVSLIDHCW
jgi:hypothetical protein